MKSEWWRTWWGLCWRRVSVGQGETWRRWRGRQGSSRDRVLFYQYLRWIRTELVWCRESNSYFEDNFPIFSLSRNSNFLRCVMFSIECIFHVAPSIGFRQVMFEYKLYPVFFYYYWQTFIWETYIDIADDKGCFKVPLKAEFT